MSQVGVGEQVGEKLAVLYRHHGVVVADGHEGGLDDPGQAVELGGVGDPPGGERSQLGVSGGQVGWFVAVGLSELGPAQIGHAFGPALL